MHSATVPCLHAPKQLATTLSHASMPPSSLCHLHEAAESDRAAGGVSRAHSLAPATATARPSENSAATEGQRLTAFELGSLYQ